MNKKWLALQDEVIPELWDEVERKINHEEWRECVAAAANFITLELRKKSGLDLDGENLANRCFSSNNPKIEINGRITESERNIHDGMREITKGFYKGMRNPVSHAFEEIYEEDAFFSVVFANWLGNKVREGVSKTSSEFWIKQLTGKNAPYNTRAIKAAVKSIAKGDLVDVFVEVFKEKLFIMQRRNGADELPSQLFQWGYIFTDLSLDTNSGLKRFFTAIKDELAGADKERLVAFFQEIFEGEDIDQITLALEIMDQEEWEKIDLFFQEKVQNMVVRACELVECKQPEKRHEEGCIETKGRLVWASARHFEYFSQREQVYSKLIARSEQASEGYWFIAEFLWDFLPEEVTDKLLPF